MHFPTTVFRQIEREDLLSRSRVLRHAAWLTWADDFRDFLSRHRQTGSRLRPRLKSLGRRREYATTFQVKLESDTFPGLAPLVADLLRFDPGPRLYFFTDLDCGREGWTMHALFALLRTAIAEQTGDPWTALYTPLAWTGGAAGDFALHADLYLPTVLFNVFEDVPADGSGRTTLLPIDDFFESLSDVPAATRSRLVDLFTRPIERDAYEELFDLLHGEHEWTAALEARLASRQSVIALARNEGYLLNDRRWLHGREAPTGGVKKNRVRRLIYGPTAPQSR